MMKEQQQGLSIMEMLQRGKAQQQQVEHGINSHKQTTRKLNTFITNYEISENVPEKFSLSELHTENRFIFMY